jgi:hypothetical protein
MHLGNVVSCDKTTLDGKPAGPLQNSSLLELALKWLRADLQERGERSDRVKWDDIADSVMTSGPLERNKEDGFAKYFAVSRART